MSTNNHHLPDSYIKEVAIKIDSKYEFDNSPHNFSEPESKIFLGRTNNTNKLVEFLNNKTGVYLVTGYRGMGKTSFVNRAVGKYKELADKKKKNIPIPINLTQSELKEIDILKLMVSSVYDKCKDLNKEDRKKEKKRILLLFMFYTTVFVMALILIFLFRGKEFNEFLQNGQIIKYVGKLPGFDIIKWITYGLTITLIIIGIVKFIIAFFCTNPQKDNFLRLKKLVNRCYSNVTKEKSSQTEAFLEALNTRISGPHEKETQYYPLATAKEIEHEFSEFLEKESKFTKFIFIFDELDKMEPAVVTTSYYEDLESFDKSKDDKSYLHQLRNRKQAVLNTIAGLKNFLTTAKSNFIFIAGREMFDASLADIADRQSSISSIFNYVFYLDSLLKEHIGEKKSASLSIIIESYLERILFPGLPADNNLSLFKLISNRGKDLEARESSDVKKEIIRYETAKVVITLQNFIVYLTYRSNGSPKKLIRAIHEFVSINNHSDNAILFSTSDEPNTGKRKYLYFNYNDQYRIGFINYLYKPFLVIHGRSLKENSDSIVVATPYLFDHLLKFHPFAFSLTNMELIPEVMATSKTPSLKEHISTIVNYLSHNHIRETEIGLFDYKFYSRTLNELSFISKTFEDEGAAFNFTLDESYLVKLHVRSKIKELRSIYSKFNEKTDWTTQQVFSISYLNGILGDLHFFDEEYDDAIIAYSDAIKPINSLDMASMSMRDFITLIKNQLKLGLCFEKINSYEESLAFYTDAAQVSKRYINYQLVSGIYLPDLFRQSRDSQIKPVTFYNSSLNELLQVVNQAFLAKLIVQEKMGLEGITANKIAISFGGFLKLAKGIEKYCGKNHLIHANFYLMIGNILYFKNENIIQQQLLDPTYKMPETEYRLFMELEKFTFNSLNARRRPILAIYFYIMGIKEILSSKVQNGTESENPYKSLVRDLDNFIYDSPKDGRILVRKVFEILDNSVIRRNPQFSKYHYKYLAILLSNIGDCLLSIYTISDRKQNSKSSERAYTKTSDSAIVLNKIEETDMIFDMKSVSKFKKGISKKSFIQYLKKSENDETGLTDILRYYHLSANYFKRRARNISASFQYRKILYTLRLVLSEKIHEKDKDDRHSNILDLINHTILHEILIITSQNGDYSDRHSTLKFEEILSAGTNNENASWYSTYIRNNISSHPEIREAILLYAYIKLKLTGNPEKKLVNPYNSIGTQFTRLLEIEYFSRTCSYQLTNAKGYEKRNLIVDYIYSLISELRILHIYGADYLVGYAFIGYIHYQMAQALEKYLFNVEISEKETILKAIKDISRDLGSYASFDPVFHYQMAIQNYEKAQQLHASGPEYKIALNKMLYLEDDINDNAAHFGAAMERFLIINDDAQRVITYCKRKMYDDYNQQHLFDIYTYDINKTNTGKS